MDSTTAVRTGASIGDIDGMIASFLRGLRAGNLSPKAIEVYRDSARQLASFLRDRGMPTEVSAIRREHVEAFIEELLAKWKPATASARFRALQQFFKFLLEEGEITESPMARMRPPMIPEQPPAILRESELKALLEACDGQDFEDRRDSAIIRCFIDTGARLAEIRGLRYTPNDPETNDVELDGAVLRVMGKGRRGRLVPLGAKSVKALDRYLRVRARHPIADSFLCGWDHAVRWATLAFSRCSADGRRKPVSRPGRSTPTRSATPSRTRGWPVAGARATSWS
jgi:site-specific recombinase XerD